MMRAMAYLWTLKNCIQIVTVFFLNTESGEQRWISSKFLCPSSLIKDHLQSVIHVARNVIDRI